MRPNVVQLQIQSHAKMEFQVGRMERTVVVTPMESSTQIHTAVVISTTAVGTWLTGRIVLWISLDLLFTSTLY
jgi:hypothetical protein